MAKVLIVEDDETTSTIVAAQLKKKDHRVVVASTAGEALEIISDKGAPDVVVLDIGLPDLDGRELLRKLRDNQDLEKLPVIFLTSHISPEEVEEGEALGARYLTKPFVLSALLGAIDQSMPKEELVW